MPLILDSGKTVLPLVIMNHTYIASGRWLSYTLSVEHVAVQSMWNAACSANFLHFLITSCSHVVHHTQYQLHDGLNSHYTNVGGLCTVQNWLKQDLYTWRRKHSLVSLLHRLSYHVNKTLQAIKHWRWVWPGNEATSLWCFYLACNYLDQTYSKSTCSQWRLTQLW